MNIPTLTKGRIALAFTIAIFADICEFPITYCEDFGWQWLNLLAKLGGALLNLIVAVAMTMILGFHWAFLPSFFVEMIPGVDMFPSWVAAVAYVMWERKKQQQNQSVLPAPLKRALGVLTESALNALPATTRNALPQSPVPSTIDVPAQVSAPNELMTEGRLKNLQELNDKNLISRTEFETRRQQILAEI